MDFFPLINSIRIALIASLISFFLGIFLAHEISKLPRGLKGVLDAILTLPLVLPPTVIGFFILRGLGPNSLLGSWFMEVFGLRLVMNWYSSIIASVILIVPLIYRTARGAFEAFDMDLKYAAQTLGKSDSWIFWRIIMPASRKGILAGLVLGFARALGEYGATNMVSGYTPGKTATISTTVYQLWRTGEEGLAYRWVLINLAISLLVLMVINLIENQD